MKKVLNYLRNTLWIYGISIILIPIPIKGQTIKEVRKELIKQNIPHYEIVLAQARHETGNFTSKLCKEKHNLFGIKHKGKYAKYSSWRASISDYKKCISSRYTGGDYYAFLRRIGYAKDPRYTQKLKRIVNDKR